MLDDQREAFAAALIQLNFICRRRRRTDNLDQALALFKLRRPLVRLYSVEDQRVAQLTTDDDDIWMRAMRDTPTSTPI